MQTLSTSQDSQKRAQAALKIGMLGPQVEPIVPELLEMAKKGPPQEKGFAILALGYIHAQPEKCLPIIYEAMEDDNPANRRAGFMAFSNFPPEQIDIDRVAEHLETNDTTLLRTLLEGFGHLGEHARPYLDKIEADTDHNNLFVRKAAQEAVKKLRYRMN